MSTLSEVASKTRNIIKFGAVSLAAFVFLRIILIAGVAYWKKLHPPPPPPATVEYGKLPRLRFADQSKKTLNFNLQLPTLEFPVFPDRAKVFYLPLKKADFAIWDTAKAQAQTLGFGGEPEQIDNEVYRWTKISPVPISFELNIINGSFTYEYAWQEDTNILSAKRLPGEQQAILDTVDFVKKVNPEGSNLGQEAKVVYLKVVGAKLQPVVSFSEADLVQVNLFPPKIEELSVVTPNPAQGVASALLSGSPSQKVLKLNYNYFPINPSLFATYPLKTAKLAWQELQDGKGFLASLADKAADVTVRRVYLGYYATLTPQSYLQPVYIFTGDGDFMGYVPAITDEWLE